MPSPSAFAPLRHPAFRALWIANLASNTGMWIQNTGAGWLMTSLAPSPVMVSLVQAAAIIKRRDGWGGFFRGLKPRIVTTMPSTAICW